MGQLKSRESDKSIFRPPTIGEAVEKETIMYRCLMMLLLLLACGCADNVKEPPWANEPAVEITVENPVSMPRTTETIVLDWETVDNSVPGLTKENAANKISTL